MEQLTQKPTVRSIAAACGISRTTAALALRDSPLVSAATRNKIKAEAARVGYQTDANITKLMGYLRRCKGERALCNLGWINSQNRHDHWRTVPWDAGLYKGSKERAAQLGYALDEIWLCEPGFKLERLPNLLRSRGIEGLLLPPPLWEISLEKFVPWEELHSVVIFEPRHLPNLHRVDFDYTYNIQLALLEVAALGYRRPGLVTSRFTDARSNHAISGQFLAEQEHPSEREKVGIFWTEGWTGGDWNEADFLFWYKREKPDVLFVSSNEWLRRLNEMGIRVPQDVGLIHMEWASDVASWAGIDLQRELAGSSAVDLLTAHIARGEKGVPPYVKEVQVRGLWRAGATVMKIERKKRASRRKSKL